MKHFGLKRGAYKREVLKTDGGNRAFTVIIYVITEVSHIAELNNL